MLLPVVVEVEVNVRCIFMSISMFFLFKRYDNKNEAETTTSSNNYDGGTVELLFKSTPSQCLLSPTSQHWQRSAELQQLLPALFTQRK